MKKYYPLLFIFTILALMANGQDRIIKISQDTIKCQIKEIGDDEVKYTQNNYTGDVIYGIDKNKISRIIFNDGKELKINDSMFDAEIYNKQRKNVFKIGFLSPLVGATSFTYEKSLKPGKSIEATMGVIGLGITGTRDPKGLYFKFGYKFIKSPDFYQKGTRFDHILKGAYVRPEISISSYTINSKNLDFIDNGQLNSGGVRESNTMFAFMINLGKQWVFDNRFVLDWFAGLGYGFGHSYQNNGNHYAFMGGVPDFPLAVTSGIRIGILF